MQRYNGDKNECALSSSAQRRDISVARSVGLICRSCCKFCSLARSLFLAGANKIPQRAHLAAVPLATGATCPLWSWRTLESQLDDGTDAKGCGREKKSRDVCLLCPSFVRRIQRRRRRRRNLSPATEQVQYLSNPAAGSGANWAEEVKQGEDEGDLCRARGDAISLAYITRASGRAAR